MEPLKRDEWPETCGQVTLLRDRQSSVIEICDVLPGQSNGICFPDFGQRELFLIHSGDRFVFHHYGYPKPVGDQSPIWHRYWYGGDRGDGQAFLIEITIEQARALDEGEDAFYRSLVPEPIRVLAGRVRACASPMYMDLSLGVRVYGMAIAHSWMEVYRWLSAFGIDTQALPDETELPLDDDHVLEGKILSGVRLPGINEPIIFASGSVVCRSEPPTLQPLWNGVYIFAVSRVPI